jgi:hypothetical protein
MFVIACRGCGHYPPDAGFVPCSNLHIQVARLSLRVGDETFGEGKFIETGSKCTIDAYGVGGLEGTVVRYVGDLRAGKLHEIHYPMSYAPNAPVATFQVNAQAIEPGTSDASPASAAPGRSSSGCSLGPASGVASPLAGAVGLLFALLFAVIRRGRRRQSGSAVLYR